MYNSFTILLYHNFQYHKINKMENNGLCLAMLDIPGLYAEKLRLLSLVERTHDFVRASIRTVHQKEQLSDDWYAFYTCMIEIKQILLARPYQTRAIKKALFKVNNYLTITEGYSLAIMIEL